MIELQLLQVDLQETNQKLKKGRARSYDSMISVWMKAQMTSSIRGVWVDIDREVQVWYHFRPLASVEPLD